MEVGRLPEQILNDLTNVFNAMGITILKTILYYFVAPFIGVILICRFAIGMRGNILKITILLTASACLFLFVNKGLPQMTNIYYSILNN